MKGSLLFQSFPISIATEDWEQTQSLLKRTVLTCIFIEKETPTQLISCEFYEICKKIFYIRPPAAAFEALKKEWHWYEVG